MSVSVFKLTTETGSVYEIDLDGATFTKNGRRSPLAIIYAVPDWRDFYGGHHESFNPHIFAENHGRLNQVPNIGECLYVSGLKEWHLSTKIVEREVIS